MVPLSKDLFVFVVRHCALAFLREGQRYITGWVASVEGKKNPDPICPLWVSGLAVNVPLGRDARRACRAIARAFRLQRL
jgi:hypothetical protein